MFEQIFYWSVDTIQNITESMPDMWQWLNTEVMEGLGITPLGIFGFSGLVVVLAVLVVHFVAIWS